MSAITQPRTIVPYVGGRYRTFAGKETPAEPDFMHGSLQTFLSLDGEIKMTPTLSGEIHVENQLSGKIQLNP